MATALITRKEAQTQGLKRYFTGEPCRLGHVAERYTSSMMCADCCVLILRKRYQDSPEREKSRSKAWYAENRDRAQQRDARYRKDHPEQRRAAEKRWKDANPEKVREMSVRASRNYAKKHPEARAESQRKWMAVPENGAARKLTIKAWRQANPEKSRAIVRNRRAKVAGSAGTHTAAELKQILEAQGHRCAYCRADLRKVTKHADHIVPIARGGSNVRTNLQYLCASCNRRKNATDPITYAQSIGLLL